jgi:hypothetical protein
MRQNHMTAMENAMNRLLSGLVLFISLLALSGCATFFDSDPRTINVVTSNGETAKVEIRGEKSESSDEESMVPQTVTAPTQFVVPKKAGDLRITVVDECYKSNEGVVHPRKVTTGFWFNIIGFTGLLGPTSSAVDSINGNMWTYESTVVVPVAKDPNAPTACGR